MIRLVHEGLRPLQSKLVVSIKECNLLDTITDLHPAYETPLGKCYNASVEDFVSSKMSAGDIDLIFTSPPFPLNRKKRYGNKTGYDYLEWIGSLAKSLRDLTSETGSIVLEIGNAWERGVPAMSTLPLEALLRFKNEAGLFLCQQFVWYNTAKLPSPVQWVNKERSRVKDSYTNIWWLSKNPRPKADNRNVLQEYSRSMKRLLRNQSYNDGLRPSEHKIGSESFLSNNGGAIPSNVIVGGNTTSTTAYLTYCKERNLPIHPTRMPSFLPEFFVRLLTDPKDLVYDPFAGSNTTGEIAEKLSRRWIATEIEKEYVQGSFGRFLDTQSEESVT